MNHYSLCERRYIVSHVVVVVVVVVVVYVDLTVNNLVVPV